MDKITTYCMYVLWEFREELLYNKNGPGGPDANYGKGVPNFCGALHSRSVILWTPKN